MTDAEKMIALGPFLSHGGKLLYSPPKKTKKVKK